MRTGNHLTPTYPKRPQAESQGISAGCYRHSMTGLAKIGELALEGVYPRAENIETLTAHIGKKIFQVTLVLGKPATRSRNGYSQGQ
jgi:hypothetical protein